MSDRSYRIAHFTATTWTEFLAAGGKVAGFRRNQWTKLQRLKPGDYLLCYLIRASRFVGVLEVASPPFEDSSPIWKSEDFPSRVRVNAVVVVRPEMGIPIHDLSTRLSIFSTDRRGAQSWVGHVRGPLLEWRPSDADVVLQELIRAKRG